MQPALDQMVFTQETGQLSNFNQVYEPASYTNASFVMSTDVN